MEQSLYGLSAVIPATVVVRVPPTWRANAPGSLCVINRTRPGGTSNEPGLVGTEWVVTGDGLGVFLYDLLISLVPVSVLPWGGVVERCLCVRGPSLSSSNRFPVFFTRVDSGDTGVSGGTLRAANCPRG